MDIETAKQFGTWEDKNGTVRVHEFTRNQVAAMNEIRLLTLSRSMFFLSGNGDCQNLRLAASRQFIQIASVGIDQHKLSVDFLALEMSANPNRE